MGWSSNLPRETMDSCQVPSMRSFAAHRGGLREAAQAPLSGLAYLVRLFDGSSRQRWARGGPSTHRFH